MEDQHTASLTRKFAKASRLNEVLVIARQAGKYEQEAVSRETSLAFNLIRAIAQVVAEELEEE